MINIDINELKKLRFKISLSGIQPKDLTGSMKIIREGVEYGFPIKIENGDIVVEIGPLSKVYGEKIKDGSLLESKLEVIAGDNYLVPWKDKIKVNNPIKIEAKIEDIAEEIKDLFPKIEVSNVLEENIKNKKIEEKEEKPKSKSKFAMMMKQSMCKAGEKW